MFSPTVEQYQPIGNRLLLEVVGTDKKGEIFLPKTVKERWMPVVDKGSIVDYIEIGDMVSAFAKKNLIFQRILIEHKLKSEDIENLTWWLENIEEKNESNSFIRFIKSLRKSGNVFDFDIDSVRIDGCDDDICKSYMKLIMRSFNM